MRGEQNFAAVNSGALQMDRGRPRFISITAFKKASPRNRQDARGNMSSLEGEGTMRRAALVCCVALVLAACGRSYNREMAYSLRGAPAVMAAPAAGIVARANSNALFSQQHDLTLTMPHDSVAARFQAARDACLKDASLHCTLASASLTENGAVSAELQVALPHNEVAIFQQRLLKRLPQDGNGRVEITASNTSTENQTQSAADIDRELAQAGAYRDSLEALAKRSGLTVDEVIKIHSELVQAQAAVDNAEAAKRASATNIGLERMNISLQETFVPPPVPSPFADFWTNAVAVLAQAPQTCCWA
jgi:hypothetical protein